MLFNSAPKDVKMSMLWKVESEKSQAMAEEGRAASTDERIERRRRTASEIGFSWLGKGFFGVS